jgi:hypothetical protein
MFYYHRISDQSIQAITPNAVLAKPIVAAMWKDKILALAKGFQNAMIGTVGSEAKRALFGAVKETKPIDNKSFPLHLPLLTNITLL